MLLGNQKAIIKIKEVININYWKKCWEACQYAVSIDGEAHNIEDVVYDSLWRLPYHPEEVEQVIEACDSFGHKDIALDILSKAGFIA